MHAKPEPNRPSGVSTVVAAALAAIIAIGLVTLVVESFRSRGTPWQDAAAAERACWTYRYVSEREACMNERLVRTRGTGVAGNATR